eukprot:gene35239-59858_t
MTRHLAQHSLTPPPAVGIIVGVLAAGACVLCVLRAKSRHAGAGYGQPVEVREELHM